MSDASKSVFISYRRSTSSFIARAVFMDLRNNDYDVFLDVETIDSGAFDTMILNQIAARTHFIVVLTPGALERCNDAGDWLRREIEEAMRLERNIVPLLVNEFTFTGNEQYLTGALSSLPRYNAVKLFAEYFDEAMERLRKRYLKAPEHRVEIQPTPVTDEAEIERKIEEIANQDAPTMQQLKAESYMLRALMRGERDYDAQIGDYNEAINTHPQFVEAYYKRGLVYLRKGDIEAALADFNTVIQTNPKKAESYFYRGNIYSERGDLDNALADFEHALRISPENVEDFNEELRLLRTQCVVTYHNRALNAFAVGDYPAALEDYRKANDLMPAFNLVIAGMALTRHALGHISEAVRLWKILVAQDKRFHDADWFFERWQLNEPQIEPRIREEFLKLIARL
jgi:tetratricopeptide (TPR) repeat protein